MVELGNGFFQSSWAEAKKSPKIAVIVPAYKVLRHILSVIDSIGPEVSRIYVVDDCCPEGSGEFVREKNSDPRVVVLRNSVNKGVGGAVLLGYREGIADRMDILVKMDGDGQMDAKMLPRLVRPIIEGRADYTKGNRFYNLDRIGEMPGIRIFGNAALSFMAKLSTGYWGVFDPSNGYTAVAMPVAAQLPMGKISNRYFFETDMLFRLNTLRAVVVDVPMHARYGDETSNLKISKILPEFLAKHFKNFWKRIFYNYFLRDMSVASFELPLGMLLLIFGTFYGILHWLHALTSGLPTPLGIIMLSALPILMGVQLLLAFFAHDAASSPSQAIASMIPDDVE